MSIDRAKAMQAAQKYLAKGQLDKAIVEYENVVKSDPKDARTLLKLGDLYTRKGANKEAGATYRKVAEQYAEQGFFLKAVAVCKQILKLDPAQLDVWEKLAEMYELLSLVSDALATYEQIHDAHTRAGNTRKALRALEKLAELDPDNVAARIRYAEALSKMNRAEEAAVAFLQGAELLKKQGRIDDFVKVGERLLFHQPDNHAFARDLAAAYLDKRDAKLALTKLQPCFSADPRNVDTLRLLARAFEQLGQVQKTISVLKEAARVYAEEQKTAEQGSVLRKIVALDPNDRDAKNELAQVGAPMLDDEAIEVDADEEEAVIIDEEEDEPTRRRSGSGLRNLQEGSGASRVPSVAPRAGADDQKRAQVARMLSECDVFMRYGLYDKMIAQLNQVLDLEPHSVEARARLKDVYLKTNKTADAVMQLVMLAEVTSTTDVRAAREHLREAIALDPKNRVIADRLAALDAGGDAGEPAGDDDDIIVLDHDDEEPAVEESRDSEISFASVNPEPARAPARAKSLAPAPVAALDDGDDDEPEMTLEDGEPEEIVMEAEDDEDDAPITAREPSVRPAAPLAAAAPRAAAPKVASAPPAPKPAPVAAAPLEDSTEDEELPEELAEAHEEVDFYLKQDMAEEARETLFDIALEYPDHPAVAARRAAIDAADGGGAGEAEDTGGDDAFAMAQKLANDPGPAAPSASGAGGPVEVEDVLAQFKRGVAKQIDKDDSATHYDLGIAYMEMGLHVEAIDEFKLCLTDPKRVCTAHTMIGLSYVAKGDMEPGVEHFKRALAEKPNSVEETGLWFEIGNAFELLGKNMEALVWYEKVEERDATFRDVAQRIERLGVSRTDKQEADEFDEMFDNMIVKE